MTRSDVRFLAVILVLFLAGAGLRWREGRSPATPAPAAGASTRPPTLVGPSFTPITSSSPNGGSAAAETVLKFYDAVNRGRYEEAAALGLENHWRKTAPLTYQLDGLTPEATFVQALESELVSDGFVITIHSIEALSATALPPAQQNPATQRELWALTALPPGREADGLYEVPVRGTVLMSCTKWDFFRRVTVVHLKGDGGWKVLLPGPLEPTANHYSEWLRN